MQKTSDFCRLSEQGLTAQTKNSFCLFIYYLLDDAKEKWAGALGENVLGLSSGLLPVRWTETARMRMTHVETEVPRDHVISDECSPMCPGRGE